MTLEPGSPRVAVITATLGHAMLRRAADSVQAQTYPHLSHVVVVDGRDSEPAVTRDLAGGEPLRHRRELLVLPERTGADGWCSHRISAALPFLVNADYVAFLDQDNWYDPDHIETLVAAAHGRDQPCAYSLRRIYDRSGRLICRDDCQSLGLLDESYDTPGERHIDSNCLFMRRLVAVECAPYWHHPLIGDRLVARHLMARFPAMPCTGRYSVGYTAGSRVESATVDYFLRGNARMAARHPGGLPWQGGAPP